MKERKRYYLEVDGKIEEPIAPEEMAYKLQAIQNVMQAQGFTNIRGELKENPSYDGFGNLWE